MPFPRFARLQRLFEIQCTPGEHGDDRKSERAIKPENISLEPERGTSRACTLAHQSQVPHHPARWLL
jgi:hypothetical protein